MNYYVIKYTITEYFDEVEEKHFNVSNLFTSKKEAKEHLVREGFEEKKYNFQRGSYGHWEEADIEEIPVQE
ncbi:hypothetical protein ACFZL0_000687 [Staphylococcus pseudintermedius]|nr:hypothetical protein [Staphylococcus pseudintermedius]EGQ4471002.1 hypothetical protein [Staphylococcus pseudintermedius]EGQ4488645.1 hypothetical protein [Staphylococcus pseudintermedius]EHD5264241.1 hypothetical protein [Staphylococcus pseudintermedius]EII2700939.1 hypothetical protein [Staphylococcus pseudintermedius]